VTVPLLPPDRPSAPRLAGFVVLAGLVALGLATFSAYPWVASAPEAASLRVAFKHVAPFEATARGLSAEELARLPKHMRPQSVERARTGRRHDTTLRVVVDGRVLVERTYRPGGLRHDGPTFGYEELPLATGRRRLEVTLDDGAGSAGSRGPWRLAQELEVPPGRAVLVELTEEVGLVIR
jgi:hypothetical protein